MKRILALGALLLVLAVCIGAWWVQTARALDLVEVHTAQPVCVGATVEGDHTILAQRGMSCTVRVTLSNAGTRTVHVDDVWLPYFGSQARWVIQAGPSTAGRLEDDGVDATLPIDEDLDSGDLLQFDIQLAYRDGGCSAEGNGGARVLKPWPTVRVGFLGRTVDSGGDGELKFGQAGPTMGCQEG